MMEKRTPLNMTRKIPAKEWRSLSATRAAHPDIRSDEKTRTKADAGLHWTDLPVQMSTPDASGQFL